MRRFSLTYLAVIRHKFQPKYGRTLFFQFEITAAWTQPPAVEPCALALRAVGDHALFAAYIILSLHPKNTKMEKYNPKQQATKLLLFALVTTAIAAFLFQKSKVIGIMVGLFALSGWYGALFGGRNFGGGKYDGFIYSPTGGKSTPVEGQL